jgi:hypothetical protein
MAVGMPLVEQALLELVCRQSDDVAALEQLLSRDGLVMPGAQLALPDEADRPLTAAARQAQKAGRARWDRLRYQRERAEPTPPRPLASAA